MIVFIDSGVLGLLTNPKKEGKPRECEDWLYSLLAKGVYVVSSDICDYEVRRSLLFESVKNSSLNSLNNLFGWCIALSRFAPDNRAVRDRISHILGGMAFLLGF